MPISIGTSKYAERVINNPKKELERIKSGAIEAVNKEIKSYTGKDNFITNGVISKGGTAAAGAADAVIKAPKTLKITKDIAFSGKLTKEVGEEIVTKGAGKMITKGAGKIALKGAGKALGIIGILPDVYNVVTGFKKGYDAVGN